MQDVFPCTAEQFFNILLNDDSNFTNEYRSARKDSNLVVSNKLAYGHRPFSFSWKYILAN